MKSKQIFIFSDLEDLRSILHDFETNYNVQYYATGLFDNPDTPKYSSIFDVTNLGISNVGDWNLCLNLLVIDKSDSIKIREVPQRKGGIKYAIDQMINPRSILLKTGGAFKEGVLVAGAVGTISNDLYSNTLFNNISKKIKTNHTFIWFNVKFQYKSN